LRGAQWRLSNAACASRSGSSRPKTSGPSLARGQRSPT
jgi:hypothetical protein